MNTIDGKNKNSLQENGTGTFENENKKYVQECKKQLIRLYNKIIYFSIKTKNEFFQNGKDHYNTLILCKTCMKTYTTVINLPKHKRTCQ